MLDNCATVSTLSNQSCSVLLFWKPEGKKLLERVQLPAEGELLQVSTVGNASRPHWITTAEGKVIQSQMKVEGHCVQTCTSSLCNHLFAQ